jgi:hypothetical protein
MGQHWYTLKGEPLYTVKGANGKERDTTLRDARKLKLVPSYTTVAAVVAKPGLDNYLQTQLLNAVMEVGYSHNCNDNEKWKKTVVEKSRRHSQNAAKRGSEIHDALEKHFSGGKLPETMKPICLPVIELLEEKFTGIKWDSETSFAHPLGFGGKVDLSHKSEARQIILDFKTKDTDNLDKVEPYSEHKMQTAAYGVGLGFTKNYRNFERYNVFISTKVPGLVKLTRSTDFVRDWGMFKALLDFWQLKNNYIPEIKE